jgi:hypothetical protein
MMKLQIIYFSCTFIASIWEWIGNFNNFTFHGSSVQDLWTLDYGIPLKNKFVVEFVIAVLFDLKEIDYILSFLPLGQLLR